ncbi:hypothetical protein ONR75_18545 [Rhodopseudomonas sp. P2A-2r]|uniref:hypothetical protein n=1 Tax=Rhodopseudomonas sp. P2A-2r TaxID=2991972 RepID=UPI00223450FC|nr:hypothetical protein [Rhodopseudomonas sp. P2A-2r]UZE47004.1 hypothetical protein ONR75_18545 [Rhodopseudomonas sp. P2A-2r]
MFSQISFTLVTNPRAQFTHFIDNSGMVAVLDNDDKRTEARVGVFRRTSKLRSALGCQHEHRLREKYFRRLSLCELPDRLGVPHHAATGALYEADPFNHRNYCLTRLIFGLRCHQRAPRR